MNILVRPLQPGCKVEDTSRQLSARLDSLGRWCTFRDHERLYRRSFDGRIVIGAQALEFSASQHYMLHQQIINWLKSLTERHPLIAAGARMTPEKYLELSAVYKQAYPEPVVILPPDRYRDIVLYPAKGCPNRKCTFCAFYKDKPYRVFTTEQLQQHVQSVQLLTGSDYAGRDGVFLGSANAMALSQRRLTPVLDMIQEQLGCVKRGVACFSDPDFSAPRSAGQWQELKRLNLVQVVIGLETGWGELRAELGKSGNLDKVQDQVRQLHAAGINVGLTVLTGTCPDGLRSKSIAETTRFLQQLNLRGRDKVYLSPVQKDGVVGNNARSELKVFKDALKPVIAAQLIPYQMERFNYYT